MFDRIRSPKLSRSPWREPIELSPRRQPARGCSGTGRRGAAGRGSSQRRARRTRTKREQPPCASRNPDPAPAPERARPLEPAPQTKPRRTEPVQTACRWGAPALQRQTRARCAQLLRTDQRLDRRQQGLPGRGQEGETAGHRGGEIQHRARRRVAEVRAQVELRSRAARRGRAGDARARRAVSTHSGFHRSRDPDVPC